MRSKILFSCFVLLYLVPWAKSHTTIQRASSYIISAEDLMKQFETDVDVANAMYLNVEIEVVGMISNVVPLSDGTIQLNLQTKTALANIQCLISHRQSSLIDQINMNIPIRVKGKCLGRLIDVTLTRCVLLH